MTIGHGHLYKIKDPYVQTEILALWRALQGQQVRSVNMDLNEVAVALGRQFKDGQIEALERFLNFTYPARALNVQQDRDDSWGLYVGKTAVAGAVYQAAYFGLSDGNLYTVKMEQEGNGGVLYLDGLESTTPILYLNCASGTGHIINSSAGAYLTYDGAWTDAACTEEKKTYIFMPSGVDILENIGRLTIGEFERHTKDGGLSGMRRMGPDAADFHTMFGVGDGHSLGGLDVASVALLGLQGALQKINELETRIAQLEAQSHAH